MSRIALLLALTLLLLPAAAPAAEPEPPAAGAAGPMTLDRLGEIVLRLDPEAQAGADGHRVAFTVEGRGIVLVADPAHDRMRLMTPIRPAEGLTADELERLMQANFDTALDARYAIARGVLWATFIHPLGPLTQRQFVEAVGQTVNAAETHGTTYSSGLLSFGGGDSGERLRRELIDELLRRSDDI